MPFANVGPSRRYLVSVTATLHPVAVKIRTSAPKLSRPLVK